MQITNRPPVTDNGIDVTLFKESQSLPINWMSKKEQWHKKVQQNRMERLPDFDGEYETYSPGGKFPAYNSWSPMEQAAFRLLNAEHNKDFADEDQARKNYNLGICDDLYTSYNTKELQMVFNVENGALESGKILLKMLQMKYRPNGYFNSRSGKSYTTQMGEPNFHHGSHLFDIPASIMQDSNWVLRIEDWIQEEKQESEMSDSDDGSASDGSEATEVPEIGDGSSSETD